MGATELAARMFVTATQLRTFLTRTTLITRSLLQVVWAPTLQTLRKNRYQALQACTGYFRE